jgi:hypothetical protein
VVANRPQNSRERSSVLETRVEKNPMKMEINIDTDSTWIAQPHIHFAHCLNMPKIIAEFIYIFAIFLQDLYRVDPMQGWAGLPS